MIMYIIITNHLDTLIKFYTHKIRIILRTRYELAVVRFAVLPSLYMYKLFNININEYIMYVMYKNNN